MSDGSNLTFAYLMSQGMERFASVLDNWILLTDKICDREIGPHNALMAFNLGIGAMYALSGKVSLANRILPHMETLIKGEFEDLRFVPGQNTVEADLTIWAMKAGRLSVEFACACEENPDLDTPENWGWLKDCQEVGLLINDCNDLTSGRFEDLIQCRRNKVLLTKFESDIYHSWRHRSEAIVAVAKEVRETVSFPPPPCDKLKEAWTTVSAQCGVEVNNVLR